MQRDLAKPPASALDAQRGASHCTADGPQSKIQGEQKSSDFRHQGCRCVASGR